MIGIILFLLIGGSIIGLILRVEIKDALNHKRRIHMFNHTLECNVWTGKVSDYRSRQCKLCTKHSWELWDIDLCFCERCANIRKLEDEIFGRKTLTKSQQLRVMEVINA